MWCVEIEMYINFLCVYLFMLPYAFWFKVVSAMTVCYTEYTILQEMVHNSRGAWSFEVLEKNWYMYKFICVPM